MTDRNNKQYEIEKILNSPDRGTLSTRGVGGILAKLFRQILWDRDVTSNRFENNLTDFIDSARRNSTSDSVSRYITRGNLRRAFEENTMTFKVFVKGMKFLKVIKINFTVELTHRNGDVSKHSTIVDLGNSDFKDDLYSSSGKE
jgi:hypothetical protein